MQVLGRLRGHCVHRSHQNMMAGDEAEQPIVILSGPRPISLTETTSNLNQCDRIPKTENNKKWFRGWLFKTDVMAGCAQPACGARLESNIHPGRMSRGPGVKRCTNIEPQKDYTILYYIMGLVEGENTSLGRSTAVSGLSSRGLRSNNPICLSIAHLHPTCPDKSPSQPR